ncbi:MAG TPA: GNAT family N-acetyltransferase [Saprospiraceae bacterium]|nr:GNAT family N-acetyltransferase [Saprospiraceae bacterium]
MLRPATRQDIPAMVRHLSNPLISKTTLHIPYPYQRSDAEAWISKNEQERELGHAYTFVIIPKGKKSMIGAIGLHLTPEHNRAEAGYWIAVPYWNKGIATEALVEIIRFGFNDLNLHKIFATHLPDNIASGNVMMKAGMHYEGELREHYKKGRRYLTVLQYGILRSAHQKGRHRRQQHDTKS